MIPAQRYRESRKKGVLVADEVEEKKVHLEEFFQGNTEANSSKWLCPPPPMPTCRVMFTDLAFPLSAPHRLARLQSKTLRERWLLEGAPSSTAEEGEAMKKQMQYDDSKAKELEESILT